MNKLILHGRTTNEPEVRTYGQNNDTLVRFGFAVRRAFKRDGQPDADFFNCTYFGKLTSLINRKGQELALDGRIENHKYKDANGVEHNAFQVIVENFDLCGSKPAETNASAPSEKAAYETAEVSDKDTLW